MLINVDNKEYNHVLFIHIPKTAGVAVLDAIYKTDLLSWKKIGLPTHEDYVNAMLKRKFPEDTFIFSIVRNPYTRAFSYYKHFLHVNKYTGYSFKRFLTFVVEQKPFFPKTPLISMTQSSFLYNQNKEIKLDKIYRYENLNEIEKDLNIKIEKANVGKYTLDDYLTYYTDDLKQIVADYYDEDFKNFGYSKEFVIPNDK